MVDVEEGTREKKKFPKVLKIFLISILILFAIVLLSGLMIRQPTFTTLEYKWTIKSDPQKLKEYVEYLSVKSLPRNHRFENGLEETRNYIYQTFKKYGDNVEIEEWSKGGHTFKNISMKIGASEGKMIVIGAHYDVWGDFPGADDNASGVAGLLELARLFSEKKPPIQVELVAYDSEEPPFMGSELMGSFVHARKLKESQREVVGMVCLEMIGYYADEQPMIYTFMSIVYPKKGDFIAVVGRFQDIKMARRFKKAINGRKGVKAVSYNGPKIVGVDLSDQRNYWSERYEAIMITDTAFLRNPYYHTDKDLPTTLDYQKMASVIDGVFSAVQSYR